MNLEVFTGKTEEEALNTALECFNAKENEIVYQIEEKKGGLFKGKSYEIKAIKLTSVVEYLKNYLDELLKNMTIKASFETSIRENQIYIKIYSDKNNILIGKEGKNLAALQTILRGVANKELNTHLNIILDISDYKEKQERNLERLAKNIAREVLKTHNPVTMDNMNSYERRLVHNALSKFKNISTLSEGEEPNRHIVVSYKED